MYDPCFVGFDEMLIMAVRGPYDSTVGDVHPAKTTCQKRRGHVYTSGADQLAVPSLYVLGVQYPKDAENAR